ncbi:MAG: hypothetical protein KHZ58_15040 [Hungatella hathewayi]|nr:hypothetical protein [Hungatella hathewayi]
MEKQSQKLRETMSEEDFSILMKQIESSNAGQEKYARKQYIMSQITAAASIVILGIVLYVAVTLLPRANATFDNLELVMGNLQVITSELADTDIDGMINNVNRLVTSSQQDVEDALSKVNAIDFDSLNKAIKDLSDVIAPLAKFVNLF